MKKIAITGGVAEGKSTVLSYLASLGYRTASADAVAREIFLQDEVQERLAELLGTPAPVLPEQLRRAMLGSGSLRRSVNRLMHPRVMAAIDELEADFIEVPLLVEACMQASFDEVWVVTCGPDEQFRRLERRIGKSEAVRLIGSQLPTGVKEAFADHIIRTNMPEEVVLQEVRTAARLAASVR